MSFFSCFVPQFPPLTGPYDVGSFEVEIPASSLGTLEPPDGAVKTVQFRVFYPSEVRTGGNVVPEVSKKHGHHHHHHHHHHHRHNHHNKASREVGAGAEGGDGGEVGGGGYKGSSWWFGKGAGEATTTTATLTRTIKPVRWLPEPHQREYLSGYARFLGASSGLAELVSRLPKPLYYIAPPAAANAPLLPSMPGFRFPTMIFSHGLGGTRLAYSYICCSLASYGVIVIAPEHRDGSAPVSFVKDPSSPSGNVDKETTKITGDPPRSGEPVINGVSASKPAGPIVDSQGRVQIDYTAYPHVISDETSNGRNRQLEIRLWELSLVYSALSKFDVGQVPKNTIVSADEEPGQANAGIGKSLLSMLVSKLDVVTPGRLIWGGHSFGSSTMIQLMKSVYYLPPQELASSLEFKPLFTPDSPPRDTLGCLSLKEQITPSSPLMLLDIWCLPLLGKRTSYLFKHPIPQIGEDHGRNVLVVMSDQFWRWREHMHGVRRVLSPDPSTGRGGEKWLWFDEKQETIHSTKEKPRNQDVISPTPLRKNPNDNKELGQQIVPPTASSTPLPPTEKTARQGEPHFFYVEKSAHLSQSDFGILFPRAIGRKAENPKRILDLNVRAALQWLRECGYDLPDSNFEDQEIEKGTGESSVGEGAGPKGDSRIFSDDGGVAGWIRIGLEDVDDEVETAKETGKEETGKM